MAGDPGIEGYRVERKYHFTTEVQVARAVGEVFGVGSVETLKSPLGAIYQVGVFQKSIRG